MNPLSSARRRRVVIRELEAGWDAGGAIFGTAAEALQSVLEEDRQAAMTGPGTVTTVEWWPCTDVGRIVAQVLAA